LQEGGRHTRRQALTWVGVALLAAAVLAVGYIAARVVDVVECHGDTAHQDITAALEEYCDDGWYELAIGWPVVFVAAGALAMWGTRRKWPVALGGILGLAAAVSPLLAVWTLA
jgi:hypothetical protein